jgi:beta-lactamase superfamily II metal-dependent hydrolase
MARFQVDLLDVGGIEYGDAILVQAGGLTALIDGGKRASADETSSQVFGDTIAHRPIDEQISDLLGGETDLDLVVVTHCHSDHIGCLPKLFAEKRLSAKWALLADPQLGYGITHDEDLLPDFTAMSAADKLRLALREEPITSDNPSEVAAFLEDAARDYTEYLNFAAALRLRLGAQCVEYRGTDEGESEGITALLAAMAPMGLKIYGPTMTQLVHCAGFLEGRSDDLDSEVNKALEANGNDAVKAYLSLRPLAGDFDGEADSGGGNGNAVNNQSLILAVTDGMRRVLLTGDMQFARPQLDDDHVKSEIKNLLDAVVADAPFDFVKLSHHGATNGQNHALLNALGATKFGISTGARSGKHPTAPTIAALEKLKQEKDARWVRVDINGRCGYRVQGNSGRLFKERNGFSDSTAPAQRAGDSVAFGPPSATPSIPRSREPERVAAQTIESDSHVEVTVRVPRSGAKVNLTIHVEPSDTPLV